MPLASDAQQNFASPAAPPSNRSQVAPPAATPATELPLVPSRQYAFRIPFTVDGIPAGGQFTAEVQLHVSEDAGRTWAMAARVAPEQREFRFQAPHDGEFWFLVLTRDAAGNVRPEGPPTAQMRVLVDTRAPQLSVKATRGGTSELNVKVRAIDEHLQLESAKVTYQTVGGEWRNVAIETLARDPQGKPGEHAYLGEATFWANDLAAGSLVRAEVRDIVGNLTIEQVRIETSTPNNSLVVSTPPKSPATPAANTAVMPAPPLNPGEVLPAPRPDARPNSTTTSASLQRPAGSTGIPAAPAATQTQLPAQVGQTPLNNQPATDPSADRLGNGYPPGGLANPNSTASPGAANWPMALPPPAAAPALSATEVLPPPASTNIVSTSGQPLMSSTSLALPPGVQPRMVNSRRFEMDYDIQASGAEPLAKVELWMTRDGGQTWALNGIDDDRVSPHRVEVNADGIFGFRMVVETQSGSRSPEPRSGDLPDVWIGVDTTKPNVQLLPVEFGGDRQPNLLRILWQADDPYPASQPVNLSFSANREGPWTPIAAGLENSGRYEWRVDARVPVRIYLRIEVRDEAGNLTEVISSDSISVEQLRPKGKILNIRPVSATRN